MKQKEYLIIITSVFILTLLWVFFNIYHNRITSTITDPLTNQIIPIEGSFDKAAINKIKERDRINPFFETINDPSKLPSPTPSIDNQLENSSSASASDQNSQTDTATQNNSEALNL